MRSNRYLATIACLAALAACALLFTWRALLLGEVFLPIDALLHMHPWRYSYERVPVNNQLTADAIRQIYPRRLLTNTIVFQGEWPLWNPAILSGTPLLDDGQIAFFYPASLIFLVAPLGWAFGAYAFVQLLLAGVGAYLLARSFGLGRGAAALAGAVYMLNGHMLNYLQLPELSGGTAVAPWCLWAVDRASRAGRWAGWGLAGLCMALPLLTQLQLAFYTYVGAGILALYHAVRLRDWRVPVGLALAAAIALGLSAIQILPELALAAQGQRSDVGFRAPEGDNLFGLLLRLALPAAGGFERVGAPPAWGPATVQIPYPYIGLAALLLAGLGMLAARHRAAWLWGAIALLAFIGAARGPLIPLLSALIPPHRQFDDHTRWLMLWSLAMAMLAAMGAESLRARAGEPQNRRTAELQTRRTQNTEQANKRTSEQANKVPAASHQSPASGRSTPGDRPATWEARASRVLLIGTLGALGVWALWYLQLFTPQSRYGIYSTLVRQQPLAATALALGGACAAAGLLGWRRAPGWLAWGLLIAVVAVDVHWFNSGYNTSASPARAVPTTDLTRGLEQFPAGLQQERTFYPPTRTVAFLQSQPGPFRIFGADYEALSPNLAAAFGLEDVRGYHSLYPERYNRLARLIDGKDYARTSEGMASLRVYLTSAYAGRRLLDMLNAVYILVPPGSATADSYAGLQLVFESDEGRIYRNTQALPRAWLVHRAEVIVGDDAQLDRLARPDFDPASLVVLDAPAPELAEPPQPERAPVVSYPTPNQVVVQASVAAPAVLVLADSYYDGWEAEVDGRPARVYRANYALRGVTLEPGEHTVVFRYRPRPFLAGGAVSLATLAGLVVWLVAARRRAGVSTGAPAA